MKASVPFLMAVLWAGGALAQVPPNTISSGPGIMSHNHMSGTENHSRLESQALEANRRNSGLNDERIALIERVAPLVQQGKCEDARRMARAEGDRPLARRIGQVCVEGRPTPMPETPPA